MKPELNIFIPTWNNADQLFDCLSSLIETTEAPYHVHVLNNGDELDGEGIPFGTFVNQRYPEAMVSVHTMGGNLGWEGALNKAWEMGLMDAPQTMVLNDDVVFVPTPDSIFLKSLMGYIVNFPEVGAVGPTTNVVMGSQNFQMHGLPVVHSTSLLIGFCCLFRTEALEKIWDRASPGPWDTSLPGGDDFDMSIRLLQAGYKLLVARKAYIHHIGFQTGQRIHGEFWNSDAQRLATDNALIKKHSVKEWFGTLQSQVGEFQPVVATFDDEGEYIRSQVNGGVGLDLGVGSNKTVPGSIGVDRVPEGESGQTGGRRGVPSIADVNADILDLPYEDDSQDYLVVRHVLEHIVNVPQALTEWRRVLRPEGVILIACPNQNKYNTMVMDSEHVHAFTPESLAPILHAFGFTCDEVFDNPRSIGFTIKARKHTYEELGVASA